MTGGAPQDQGQVPPAHRTERDLAGVGVDPSLIYPQGAGLTALSFAHVSVADSPALFTVQLIWFYALVVAGIALLFMEALRSWSLYRSQVEAVVASVGCILLFDVAFMAGYAPVRGLHMGLVAMSIGMLPANRKKSTKGS